MIVFFLWHHVLTTNSHCGLNATFLMQQHRDKGTISAPCQYYCPAVARTAVIQSPCVSGRPQNLSKVGDFIRSYIAVICRNRRKISSLPLSLHYLFIVFAVEWHMFCCMDELSWKNKGQARFFSITQMHSVFSTWEINRLIGLVHQTINNLCTQIDLIHNSPMVHTTNAASCLL